MTKVPFNNITVMGLGLMGSSLCSIIKKTFPEIKILGVSSETSLAKARELKIIDAQAPYEDCQEFLASSDLVVICTPIDHILATFEKWGQSPPPFKDSCLITDIGSTKAKICKQAKQFTEKTGATFIGSHPMAGSEKTGIESLDPLLYENAPWIICPSDNESEAQVDELKKFVRSLGSHVFAMPPETHDAVVAHVSHLPQVLSTGLAGFLSEQEAVLEYGLEISGGGLRDMTRLANSSFKMWEPIFQSNHKEIYPALINFKNYLEKLILEFDDYNLKDSFHKGFGLKQKLMERNKARQGEIAEIFVDLPDKTGILVAVLSELSNLNLNVLDTEILKVREGEAGTLRIGFKNKLEADVALECLVKAGYGVRQR